MEQHVRTSASKAAAWTLDGIPGLKGVHARRRWSYNRELLPAINFHWAVEQRQPGHSPGVPGRRIQTRDMTLRLNIVSWIDPSRPEDDPPEYVLDAYQAEVERRFAANRTLKGPDGLPTLRDLQWARTESGESTNQGGAGSVQVTSLYFDALTHHREGFPTHPLRD